MLGTYRFGGLEQASPFGIGKRGFDDLPDATLADQPVDRYACAHRAALRTAAAVLAARAKPSSSRRRLRSVWVLLPEVAPELGEWAEFFAAGARKRAAAEAGIPVVSSREADDLLRDAELFLARVAGMLGIGYRQSALISAVHLRPVG